MNDEDFARQAFAAAFRSGPTGEPPTLPDVERLASRARRATRQRHGAYAAGTTALAGVVTAGIVTGPALLGLGSPSPSGVSAAAGGSSVSPTPSKSPAESPGNVKPSGVPCANPPAIDWAAVVAAALPAGIHAAPDHAVNCLDFPEGSRSIQAGFTLSVPGSVLQISVEKGGALTTKLGQASQPFESKPVASGSGSANLSSASPSLEPSVLASLQAMKRSMAADSSAVASLDAMKQSMAATDNAAAKAAAAKDSAAASASAARNDSVGKTPPTCHKVAANITACASTVTKGGFVGTDVQLIRTGPDPVVVDVVAASGIDAPSPAPGTKAPLDDAQVTAIAQAVVAHF